MNRDKSNADKFLIIYNELDKHMRTCLKAKPGTPNSHLIKLMAKSNRIFLRYKEDLLAFSRLRNAIIHNPYKKDAEPIAEPHDNVIERYEEILEKLTCPPSALSTVAIPRKKIFTTDMESKVFDIMRVMLINSYTHVPVVYNDRMIGVFSENTVFTYLAEKSKQKDVVITRDTQINEFKNFIEFEGNESEYYEFVSKETLLIDVEKLFQKDLKNNKRLAVVFITENGKQGEKLLGLVTIWDIVNKGQD